MSYKAGKILSAQDASSLTTFGAVTLKIIALSSVTVPQKLCLAISAKHIIK